MDNHPIPQDITGFQFKLIGNMTVRQFGYLAGGVILAWVCYVLPFPLLVRLPFIAMFALLGVAFAFLPVDGRPMDAMFGHLLKALFSPTQFIYHKSGGNLMKPVFSNPQPTQTSQIQPTSSDADTPQVAVVQQIQAPQPQQAQPLPKIEYISIEEQSPPQLPREDLSPSSEEELIKTEEKLEEKAEDISKELEEVKSVETASEQSPEAHEKAVELEKMLADTVRQKEELERELIMLKTKLTDQNTEKFTPAIAQAPKVTQNVKQVPAGLEKSVGIMPTPEAPNLITGIIKDPRGNPLQNILVEVKDTEGNPVRAFKTNGLGHFASATSLVSGKYSVTFEDPKEENKFDAVEVEATGESMMPLEIISIDSREELRRELFN